MEIAVSIFILAGCAFALVAAVGTHRFPDALSRMHAATKAGSFGASLLLVGAGLFFSDWVTSVFAAITVALFYLTAPIAAQLIGKVTRSLSEETSDKTHSSN